jgi:hypothetical protein
MVKKTETTVNSIRIGEKHYNAEKLTEPATALLGDLQKVENELSSLTLKTSIINLAKSTLVEKLVEETANLEEVDAPKATS